jgi:hypothetical protein
MASSTPPWGGGRTRQALAYYSTSLGGENIRQRIKVTQSTITISTVLSVTKPPEEICLHVTK